MSQKPLLIQLDIAVKVKATPLERLVIWLGGPERVGRICDAGNMTMALLVVAYVGLWTVVFGPIGILGITTGWTSARITVASMGWFPLLGGQLLFGALRYAVFTLTLKESQARMEMTNQQYRDLIDRTVQDCLDHYFQARDGTAPPTLQ